MEDELKRMVEGLGNEVLYSLLLLLLVAVPCIYFVWTNRHRALQVIHPMQQSIVEEIRRWLPTRTPDREERVTNGSSSTEQPAGSSTSQTEHHRAAACRPNVLPARGDSKHPKHSSPSSPILPPGSSRSLTSGQSIMVAKICAPFAIVPTDLLFKLIALICFVMRCRETRCLPLANDLLYLAKILAECFMTYWRHGNWLGAVNCPVCRARVSLVLASFQEADLNTEGRSDAVNDIRQYNRRFSGEPRTVMEYIRDIPVLLSHLAAQFFTVNGLMLVFRLRVVGLIFAASVYILSPLDIIPEAVFGLLGFFDDLFVLIMLALYLSVAYRQVVRDN